MEKVVWVSGGHQKTDLLRQRATSGALSPSVREVAVRLVRGVPENDHQERLERLHRFVRGHTYVREAIERFQSPAETMRVGAGDCDDLAALLGALAWSLKYPFRVVPQLGEPNEPGHYTLFLGYPETETPHGEGENRHWLAAETTPVGRGYRKLQLGEHPLHVVASR